MVEGSEAGRGRGVDVVWAVSRPTPGGDQARALLRDRVAQRLACAPRAVSLTSFCPMCGSTAHGRPHVRTPASGLRLWVSLGRTPGLVLIATSDVGPVGIDVERVVDTAFDGFADVALHPLERATDPGERAVLWARKEAVLKAVGTGLTVDPRTVRVSPAGELARLVDGPQSVVSQRVWLSDLAITTGYAACVALVSDRRHRLEVAPAAPAAARAQAAAAAAVAPARGAIDGRAR